LVVARSTSKGIFVFKITMEKKCTKCGEVKSLDEFGNDKRVKSGKVAACKDCIKKYWKIYLQKNKNEDVYTSQFTKLFHQNHGLRECSKCKLLKTLDNFCIDKKGKHGKAFRCKDCDKKYRKQYYKKYKEMLALKAKKYYEKNKEKESLRCKNYRENNKEKEILRRRLYYEKNKEMLALKAKKYYEKNKDDIINKSIIWRQNNKEISNKYTRLRKEKDPLFKLTIIIRQNISQALSTKGYTKKTKTYNILKCEYNFFMDWLNGKASNGYTYGIGELHLDHVIPISLAETEDEAILLNHYSNYQLLSADENLAKSNRYVNPANLKRVLNHHPEPNKIREIYSRL